jgi:hypothetical protein
MSLTFRKKLLSSEQKKFHKKDLTQTQIRFFWVSMYAFFFFIKYE